MRINRVAVVGAGTMGAGIAQVAATHGCRVTLIDTSAEIARRGVGVIAGHLDRSIEKGRLSRDERDAAMGRITASDAVAGLDGVELAIEAVIEDADVKHGVFRAFESAVPREAVLATNTSSLRITKIASALRNPGRVVGMHFFNPAPLMPLVEVIAGERTDANAVEFAVSAAEAWGKVAVRVKDTPGFIVNRVARGFYLEALRLLDEGVADVATIDGVMRTLGGFPMGPFQLMDLVGLDVNYAVSCSVYEQMGRPVRLAPHALQREMVERGHIGRKAGRGFYRYDGESPVVADPREARPMAFTTEVSDAVVRFAAAAARDPGSTVEQYVFCRILATIMNEAGWALVEGVASAADIDTAMEQGTRYPRGPLRWSADIGREVVGKVLRALDAEAGDGRFAPCDLFGG